MAGEKIPAMMFYPDDWLSDEKLRACSSSAIGLWIDMLCLMHKNDRRGYLQIADKPVTPVQLARMTGRTTDEVSQQLAELLNAGVPSVTDSGIVFSRRMTKDERIRQARSDAGRKGGKATGFLLKQNAKQNLSKPPSKNMYMEMQLESKTPEGIEGGAGEKGGEADAAFKPSAFDLTSEGLAQRFAFAYRGTCAAHRDPYKLAGMFGEWVKKRAILPERILAEILRDDRAHDEPPWDMLRRLQEPARRGSLASRIEAAYEKLNREAT